VVAELGWDMTRTAAAIRTGIEILGWMKRTLFPPGDGFAKELAEVARVRPKGEMICGDVSYTIEECSC
jgi:hypothetical protein